MQRYVSDKMVYKAKFAVPKQTEKQLQKIVKKYLDVQYPDIIYSFNTVGFLKLDGWKGKQQKELGNPRGYPDLFIANAKRWRAAVEHCDIYHYYHGLFIELKAEGTVIFNKNGSIRADIHLEEQAEMLNKLRTKGYKAEFAIGFDETKKIIDNYLEKLL